jgi:PAT family acetyl-CoA transporter-like MFS transporter 1
MPLASLVNSGKWSAAEEAAFARAHAACGNDWVAVARAVGTRTNTQCRGHFRSFQTNKEKKKRGGSRSRRKGRAATGVGRAKTPKRRKARSISNRTMSGPSSSDDVDMVEKQSLLRRAATGGDVELGPIRRSRSRSRSKEKKQSTALRAKKTSTREEELEVDLTGDYGNVALLLLLYTLQGIPMGLTGAVSLSLASQKGITMDQQGMFSLVSWPFSLKLLWAPIVDSLFVERFGRRKTWLVPTQLLIAAALVAMSPFVDLWLAGDVDSGIAPDVLKLTSVFFLLFFLCATQDICVDGWALTLLSKRNVGYASTCNAIGQTLGNLLSYVGWIACEKYGIMGFGSFSAMWGAAFLVTTLAVLFLVKENEVPEDEQPPTITGAYKEMALVLRNPLVQEFLIVLLTCKVAFAPEVMSQIMLVGPVGMPKEHFVMIGLFLTVPSLLAPKLVDKYTTGRRPFDLFIRGTVPRLVMIACSMLLYRMAPTPFDTSNQVWYAALGVLSLVYTLLSQAMFVAMMAFFTRISDPRIGGTYMTMLNTAGNLAFKWPSTLFMFGVARMDTYLTETTEQADRHPGFYPMTLACGCFGVAWIWFATKRMERLQREDLSKWRAVV